MHGIDSSKEHLISVCEELDSLRSRAHLENFLAKHGIVRSQRQSKAEFEVASGITSGFWIEVVVAFEPSNGSRGFFASMLVTRQSKVEHLRQCVLTD
ncbi:hypothetical protein BIZ42_02175 [Stenotrophomonas sp. LM091]|nr:hypothetical protein BIZ42_02175 [Stenotrophomonas sp. LM091]